MRARRQPKAPSVGTPADASDAHHRADIPRLVVHGPADPLTPILEQASLLLLKYPVAAQAIFSAFVAEGRRFAQTPEGGRWHAALVESELVRRGRVLWEDSTLCILEDTPGTLIPSAILDAVVEATSRADVHPLLDSLFRGWTWYDGTDPS